MAKRGGFPGGGMPGNMANLMKQAQKMQRQMEEQAKEMETKEFSATAGGGAVEVTVSGSKKILKVKLDEEVVDPDDLQCLSLPAAWVAECRDYSKRRSGKNDSYRELKNYGLLQ